MRSLLPSAAHSFCNALVPFAVFCGVAACSCRPREGPINLKLQRPRLLLVINQQRARKAVVTAAVPLCRTLRMQERTVFQNSRNVAQVWARHSPVSPCTSKPRNLARHAEKTSEIRYTEWNLVPDWWLVGSSCALQEATSRLQELENFSAVLCETARYQ